MTEDQKKIKERLRRQAIVVEAVEITLSDFEESLKATKYPNQVILLKTNIVCKQYDLIAAKAIYAALEKLVE